MCIHVAAFRTGRRQAGHSIRMDLSPTGLVAWQKLAPNYQDCHKLVLRGPLSHRYGSLQQPLLHRL